MSQLERAIVGKFYESSAIALKLNLNLRRASGVISLIATFRKSLKEKGEQRNVIQALFIGKSEFTQEADPALLRGGANPKGGVENLLFGQNLPRTA